MLGHWPPFEIQLGQIRQTLQAGHDEAAQRCTQGRLLRPPCRQVQVGQAPPPLPPSRLVS